MKTIMRLKTNGTMQGVANKTTGGGCDLQANTMNDFFVSLSDHLPRLNMSHKVFTVNEELPNQCMINVCITFIALESGNKPTRLLSLPTVLHGC